MHIRELELDNFKSCANKVTIPFLDGLTTIAGPNGSGKSNVIDSVLFCLGLSSSRSLRAKTLYDFISTHNNRNDASVRITFGDEKDEKLLTVERNIKKTSSGFISTYYLDGKSSSLSEIHEKLLDYNVSPGSYNVIMQNDVAEIVNNTPLNRRRILDEIAGVADFDRRIDQATGELEIVEKRVEKSHIVLQEIEIRLEDLKSQKEEALKFQKLREEKAEYENKLSTVKYFDIKNSLERVHENILETNKNKKNQEKELTKVDTKLDETKAKLQELSELVKQKGEDEQLRTKAQIEALKSDINTKQNSIDMINRQVENNEISSKNALENIETLKGKIDNANLRIDNKKDEIKSLEKNIEHEKQELDRVLKEIAEMSRESNDNVKKRSELRSALESKKDEENTLLKQVIPLEENIKRLERDIQEAQEVINNFEAANQKNLDEKDKLTLQIEELSKELKDYELMQKNSFNALDDTKGKIDETARNIQLAYNKVAQLEANKRAVAESNLSYPVDFIMKSKIEGVHAPLAQLGKVDNDYAAALEIAMGGRMASIVVDDEDTASICMDALISARAGRATFLPLNKIKRAPSRMSAPNQNGVIDYAINLIDFDDKYLDAFYHALGDTLIVEDRVTAQKLIGKYRMVCLDGSLYDKSAAITGGSVPKSRMQFSSTQDKELEKCKQKLGGFQDEYDRLDREKAKIEAKLNTIRQEYSTTMSELNRKKYAMDALVESMSNSEKSLDSKKQLLAQMTPALQKSQGELEELKTKQAEITLEIENLTKEIEQVEKSIPEDELSKLDELSESIEFEIRRFQSGIIKAEGEIKSIQTEITFTQQSVEAQKNQITKLKADNENFAQDKKLAEGQILQIQSMIEELQVKVKEIDEKLSELQKQRDDAQNGVLEYQTLKNSLNLNLERLEENIEALKGRRKELEPELEAIRNELAQAGYQIANLIPVEISTEDVLKAIARIDKKMAELGDVNMMAIKEYDTVCERKDELKDKLETLSREKSQIMERMQGYEDLKRKSFLDAFEKINFHFKEIFGELADGPGELILENPVDPLNGGLTIKAQHRDKKMQRLEAMSGGE
ncbi:MAG: chromosome segregation protein SMC [Candidatus Gastranaerophilales bacterium]|nr:chromosome segregation protein SMC [Candidatus Gastranaerophilales bacterium]